MAKIIGSERDDHILFFAWMNFLSNKYGRWKIKCLVQFYTTQAYKNSEVYVIKPFKGENGYHDIWPN